MDGIEGGLVAVGVCTLGVIFVRMKRQTESSKSKPLQIGERDLAG